MINRIVSQAALSLPFAGIVLTLANWRARPDRPWGWAAGIGMFLVMLAVRYGFQLAARRASNDIVKAALVKTVTTVNNGVVFGALLMIVPLAMTLAHAYGLVDDPRGANRTVSIIAGAYMVVLGNAMPRMLPPVSSMQGNGAHVQAFQRSVGWTFVLCGLGFVLAWLALPLNAATPMSMALVVAAIIITLLRFRRLVRQTRRHAPGF